MSEKIAILADSGSDLPSNLVAQDNVAIVPMQIHWHGEVLRDRVDISPNEFYRALKTSKELPKTSSPQMSDIISQVTRLREKGYTHLLVIGVSSKLSVTFNQMYLQAKSTPDLVVEGIDTKNIGIGSGQIAVYAASLIAAGLPFVQIIARLRKSVTTSRIFFYVPTLKYLAAGGRIGKVAGLLGSTLHIKPIISCDPDGVYYPIAKAHGEKRAVQKMLALVDRAVGDHQQVHLTVCDGDNLPLRTQLLNLMKEKYPKFTVDVGDISPALGVHTGPGLIGIAVNVRYDEEQ